MDIQHLRETADKTAADFDTACRPHYCDGRWGAYRAFEAGEKVPATVAAAMDTYHAAVQAYYLARDGERGFLGARGL